MMNGPFEKGIACVKKSDYVQAIGLFQQSVLLSNSRASWYNLGVCYSEIQQYEQAVEAFKKSIALEPFHISSRYNLGVCYQEMRQYDEAIEAFEAVIALDPHHAKSLSNIGFVLNEMGKGLESFEYLNQAFERAPGNPVIGRNAIANLCRNSKMKDWKTICRQFMRNKNAHGNAIYMAGIYAACAEWGLYQKGEVTDYPRPQGDEEWIKSMQSYEVFVKRLLAQKSDRIYKPGKPIYIMGDSHILSFAGLRFGNKRIWPQLIMGAKAFHVSSPKPNRYSAALKHHIDAIPEGADLLCSFGEIDCRTDEGIMPYCLKSGRALEDAVQEQVSNYVHAINKYASYRKINPVFVNIAAPLPRMGDRREVIKLFNNSLKTQAKKVIDIYSPTVGSDGYAIEGKHIDKVHLRPDIVNEAILHASS